MLSVIDEIIEHDFNVDDEAQSHYLFYSFPYSQPQICSSN
jgi:hypothetical protein